MADATSPTRRTGSLGGAAARLGVGLAIVALILLAAGPLSWRAGVLHYRIGLLYLLPGAAFTAGAAVLLSLAAFLWWRSLARPRRVLAAIGVVLGVAVLYVPFQASQLRGGSPPINDITTDTVEPPKFAAALPARAAENARPPEYDPDMARQQRAAFPDILPVVTPLPPPEAFKRALETAAAMPGWTIVSRDAASGRIEAAQRSVFYGFTDDVVIRVTAEGSGSRIDVRSASRQGRGDLGVNARRVRSYLAELKRKLG